MPTDRNVITTAAPPDDPGARPGIAGMPTLDPSRDEYGPPPPGAPFIEGYRILARLGQGGMGTVWRAVQLSTRREVALKLLGVAAGSSRARMRFEREVELAAMLEHPNLARVYDSGQEGGLYYYAMQLIDGVHLDSYVQTNRCSKEQILELMRIVCRAIQAAHQKGVIHRDLKPSNILVSADGQPHVVDFGLAKALLEGDSRHPISIDGDVAGTPAYMSPEQAAGKIHSVDTRSDVYSLGVILYQLLTGSTPHDTSGTSYEVLRRIVEGEPRTPRSIARTVDRELEALLLKALARDPDRRYASAGEFADDIENYLRGDPLTAKPRSSIYFLIKRVRKHRVSLATLGSIILILLCYVSWLYFQPARIELVTWPKEAAVFIDGIKHACCTDTHATLSFGEHRITFKAPPGYLDKELVVDVEWGKARGATPVVLAPNFQTVIFRTEPEGARVEVRDGKTRAFVASLSTTGYIVRLPTGFYHATIEKEGYAPLTEMIDITGSADALIIDRRLTARGSSGASE